MKEVRKLMGGSSIWDTRRRSIEESSERAEEEDANVGRREEGRKFTN